MTTQSIDTAADVQDMVAEFWRDLRPTRMTAACPQCEQPGLEVRIATAGARRFTYVKHCGDLHAVTPAWGR